MARFKRILLTLLAILVTLLILELVSSLFSREPISVPQENGTTIARRQPGFLFWSFREGFGYGRIDANGYNNSSVLQESDVVIMGDSHMQGIVVPQKEITSELLRKKGIAAYNIGFAAQTFQDLIRQIPAVAKTYAPKKAIVMVFSEIALDMKTAEALEAGNAPPRTLRDSPFVALLRKSFLAHLLSTQVGGDAIRKLKAPFAQEERRGEKEKPYDGPYDAILRQAKKQAGERNLLFVYLPLMHIGNGRVTVDPPLPASFVDACKKNGIRFLDMSGTLLRSVVIQHEIPFGFANSEPGAGHLNATGHRLLSDKLAAIL
jgi:hypothetical protein